MGSEIKIAVVGAGIIGRRHIQHIIDEPGCRLSGLVDPTPQAKNLANQIGTTYYPDIDLFLKKTDADAAIIATPNDTHSSIGIKCAEAGLHLLIEKPIDAELSHAVKLMETAKKKGIKILVGHHRRFNPYIVAAKQIINQGLLGTITSVNVLWTALKSSSYFDISWRKEPGGGPILINLIHDVDNLRYLLGDVERVYAETSHKTRNFAVEDTIALTLRFQSGILSTILVSDTVASPYNFESGTGENPLLHFTGQDCYRFFGTKATLNFPEMILWKYTGEGEHGWEVQISSERVKVEHAVPMVDQLRHFCDVILNDVPPRCSVGEAIKTLETTMAIKQAVIKREPVTLA